MEAWVEVFGFMFLRWRTGVLPIVAREVADGGGGGRDILLFLGRLLLRSSVGLGMGLMMVVMVDLYH